MVRLNDRSFQKIVSNLNEYTLLMANGPSKSYLVYATTEAVHSIVEANADNNSQNGAQNLFAVDLANGTIKRIPFHLNTDCYKLFHVFGTTLYCCNENNNFDKNAAESSKYTGYKFDLNLNYPQPIAFEF